MSMLDGYMDQNSSKYCTFEDNYFASPENHTIDRSHLGISGDISYDDNKAAFAMEVPRSTTITDMVSVVAEYGSVYYCTELGKVKGKL